MTVLLAMATAVTLLPAMFGFMGMRVLSRRERQHLSDHGAHDVTRGASGRAGRASWRAAR